MKKQLNAAVATQCMQGQNSKGVIMDQRITTEQLIYNIGALTLENDILRAQIEQLQKQIAALPKSEEHVHPTTTVSFNSISD